MKTISEVLPLAATFLKNDRKTAEEILASVLGIKRIELYMQFDRPLVEAELEKMRAALKRSAQGEPVEYIFGECEFYGCRLEVTPDVLIPRPETEVMVDLIAKRIKGKKNLWDLCTGSGCIGLALKRACPELSVTLSDLSPKALALAKKNAEKNHLQVEFLFGDLLQPFAGKKADAVVCNPPYISKKEYESLDVSVRSFEPSMALVGGETGFEFYERLAAELPRYLCEGGALFLEIGFQQGNGVKEIFKKSPWREGEILKDWAGHDRFFFLEIE
jgi:release factor glutamine methyltransferase